MIEAGDVAHLTWNQEFQCDVEAAKDNSEKYFAKISKQTAQFEERLENWNNELMEFRRKNPLANHFTVKQILVLRRYLKQYSSPSSTESLPVANKQVFTLLRKISKTVTPKKIRDCCLLMHGDVKAGKVKENQNKKKTDDNETNFTRFTYKQLTLMIEQFLEEYEEDASIDSNLVYASLIKVNDFSDEKKVLLWCARHENDDEDLIDQLYDQAKEELKRMEENALR